MNSIIAFTIAASQQMMPVTCYPIDQINNILANNGFTQLILEGDNPVGKVGVFFNPTENKFLVVGLWVDQGAACTVADGTGATFQNTTIKASKAL